MWLHLFFGVWGQTKKKVKEESKEVKTGLFGETSCISSQIQQRGAAVGGVIFSVATNPNTQHISSSPKMFCRVYPILKNVPSKNQYANAHTSVTDKQLAL